jgi:hypothetical protein
MVVMKTVDINRLKGNYAEHLVSLWLSEQCLVRTVSAGTDIGVDLYCEAVIENQPFLHFMVQVKAIGKDKISSNGGVKEGKFPFKNSDLVYWSKQPIPVYAFLVPVEKWPPEEPKIIYSIRLTEELIKNGIPKTGATYKTVEGIERTSKSNDLKQFLTKIVPWDTSILLLDKGIIAPIGKEESGIGDRFPEGIGRNYLQQVLSNIYNSAAWIGVENIDNIKIEEIGKINDMNLLSGIIHLFHDKWLHMLGLEFLFLYAKFQKNYNLGNLYKNQAINMITNSKSFGEDGKKKMIMEINDLFDKVFALT